MTNLKKCFIASVIGEETSKEREHSDELFHQILEPVCSNLQFKCIRIDKLTTSTNINSEILNHLTNCELVIADLTFLNPNVFYEVGYRTALGKPIIHIAKKGTHLPFDINQHRCVFYSTTHYKEINEAKENLSKFIQSINFDNYDNLSNTFDLPSEIKKIKEISIITQEKLNLLNLRLKPGKS